MKQTAVEWLFEQIYGDTDHVISYTADEKNAIEEFKSKDAIEAFEKAKAMEREQIIEAWIAIDNELQRLAAEQYYNQTYKGSEQ